MRDIRIAGVCMASPPGQIERNLRRTEHFVRGAAAEGAEIICFPELSISGYTLEPGGSGAPETKKEILLRIQDMARTWRILILAGLLEAAENQKPFISHVAAGPEGVLGTYRKTHLSPQEKEVFQPGNELQTYLYKGITFAVQLCYESHFPEISTVLALRGAEIIFVPHASPRGTPDEKYRSWLRHLPSRAFDNTLFVAACNQASDASEGLSFPGVALVLDPMARVIASRKDRDEGMLIADLKAEDLRQAREHRMKYFLPFRRPELYGEVASERKRAQ